MPYVKIQDPNIIDLAAWHQVISVVNQHSDSISALTNNFGLGWNPNYQSDDSWNTVYDAGTQTIQYGRAKMDATGTGNTAKTQFGTVYAIDQSGTNAGTIQQFNRYVYEEVVTFPNAFSSNPNVIATVSRGSSTSSTVSDFNVSISDIGPTSFKARIVNKDQTELTSTTTWYVNWIAIGPQV